MLNISTGPKFFPTFISLVDDDNGDEFDTHCLTQHWQSKNVSAEMIYQSASKSRKNVHVNPAQQIYYESLPSPPLTGKLSRYDDSKEWNEKFNKMLEKMMVVVVGGSKKKA